MHIYSHFSPGDSHVELYCCKAWRGRFAAAAKASTHFLNRQVVQAAANPALHRKFLEGLDVMELLAHVPAEPLRITPFQTFLAFHLLCTVSRHAELQDRQRHSLILVLAAIADATPCTIDHYKLPPLYSVLPKITEDIGNIYERIRQWPSFCPPHLGLHSAYWLWRELQSYQGSNTEVARLTDELAALSRMLADTLQAAGIQ